MLSLLYRQEFFTGKYTTPKIHTKLHPGLEWRIFHIPTSEDIDDVISRFFTTVCVGVVVCLYNKKNITRQLKNMNFMFEWQEQYLSMFFPLKH